MKTICRLLVLAVALSAYAATAVPGDSSAAGSGLAPATLARAATIRSAVTARYLRSGLAVTEASSTGVLESFTLLTPDGLETQTVPADNGIYYAICPPRAVCPYPARQFARPAADLAPRRLALDLVLQTFRTTSAEVVAVSLPTLRYVLLVVQRDELAREVDLAALGKALAAHPSDPLSPSLAKAVDSVTRAHTFLFLAIEPTPNGRDTWAGVPLWPSRSGG
jgi:hypothetical protein